jgi:hypothetical protein
LFRIIRSTMWLVWNKVRMPGHRDLGGGQVELKAELPVDVLGLLAVKADTAEHDVAWTVECLTGKSKGMRGVRPNVKTLVVAKKTGGPVLLVLRGTFRDTVVALPLEGARVEVESRLLSDHVVVQTAARMVTLRFPRGRGALVETVRNRLEELIRAAGTCAAEGLEASAVSNEAVDLAPLPAL